MKSLFVGVWPLLFFFLFSAQTVWADSSEFWIKGEVPEGREWHMFSPRSEKLQKQAALMVTTLAVPYQVTDAPEVMGQLHTGIERFKMLGQKQVSWGDGVATLVSFQGRQKGRRILGRALLIPKEDKTTRLVLLVRHPGANATILKQFNKMTAESLENLLVK